MTLEELMDALRLEPGEGNTATGRSPNYHAFSRIYGGQLFAQMLVAAGRTVEDDRFVHSMHAYFLRPGDQRFPTEFAVAKTLEGRTFSNRRVTVNQDVGKGPREICNLTASFAREMEGPQFQLHHPDLNVPDHEPLRPGIHEQYNEVMSYIAGDNAIEFRFTSGIDEASKGQGRWQVWFRPKGELPDDQLIHSAVVAYAADMFLLETTLRAHNIGWLDDVDLATIDYSMWFHRPFRLNGWSMIQFSANASGSGRGYASGEMFDSDGNIVVSMTQEGVTRYKPGRAEDLRRRVAAKLP